MKIVTILLIISTTLVIFTHSISKCLEQKCLKEIQTCVSDDQCNKLINDCADGGCVDFDTELVEWNCMATCVAPKRNTIDNNFVICGRKNCPDVLQVVSQSKSLSQN